MREYLDFSDVLIKPIYSKIKSRKDIELNVEYKFKYGKHVFNGIPIIASNMDGVGTLSMVDELSKLKIMTALTKTIDIEECLDYFKEKPENLDYTLFSCGISEIDIQKIKMLYRSINIKYIRMDIPHGHSEHFIEAIKKIRSDMKDVVIFAGNVVTYNAVIDLVNAGADVVSVGIGSGSVCTTRLKAGVGVPQLSAVMDCCETSNELSGSYIISDGGITCVGDINKAFVAGADFVMMGSMFAGHTESELKVVMIDGKKHIQFYGMSSKIANDKHFGGLKDYRSAEGKSVMIEYKGPVENTINDILGGIRSCCSYLGKNKLQDIIYTDNLIKVNNTHNKVYK